MDPMMVVMLAAGAGFWGSVLYLALRLVRSAERRGVDRGELEELRGRVARLEEDLLTAHTEMERLSAGQEFTAQLLASRSATPKLAP